MHRQSSKSPRRQSPSRSRSNSPTAKHTIARRRSSSTAAAAAKIPPKTHITENFIEVKQQLYDSAIQHKRDPKTVKLLAVSKTHPPEAILEAYHHTGQREFGENYVQELTEKAPILPSDIKWSFIGHLQSNKVKHIAPIPNLAMVETIDSMKLATKLNNELIKVKRTTPLNVLVQVNTSEEDQKSGVEPEDCLQLVDHIIKECSALQFKGLMTIGKKLDLDNPTAAPYFKVLEDCKELICKTYPPDIVNPSEFVLSMGMTDDFHTAIQYNSTQIRVGTALFGKRAYTASKPPAAATASTTVITPLDGEQTTTIDNNNNNTEENNKQ